MPLDELYEACKIAREILTGKHAVGRVIARPFTGDARQLRAHAEPARLLARAEAAELPVARPRRGKKVHGVGKISDIFAGVDIDESHPTKSNIDGIQQTEKLLQELDDGFVFVNLVETDSLWGHRNDPVNFHRCLQDFDRRLPDLLEALRPGDLLILTSDHGCDPTTPSTDHSREHAMLLAYVAGRNASGRDPRGRVRRRRRDRERVAEGKAPRAASRASRSSLREAGGASSRSPTPPTTSSSSGSSPAQTGSAPNATSPSAPRTATRSCDAISRVSRLATPQARPNRRSRSRCRLRRLDGMKGIRRSRAGPDAGVRRGARMSSSSRRSDPRCRADPAQARRPGARRRARSPSSCSATRAATCRTTSSRRSAWRSTSRGSRAAETFALTDAMVRSGETIDLGGGARTARRRQALDGRRGGQDDARRRADRRRVRRAVREDERPRPRAHGRHARQARVDPRLPRRARRPTEFIAQVRESASRSSARPPTSSRRTRSSTRCATSPRRSTTSR